MLYEVLFGEVTYLFLLEFIEVVGWILLKRVRLRRGEFDHGEILKEIWGRYDLSIDEMIENDLFYSLGYEWMDPKVVKYIFMYCRELR